jgi:hypothetical protein
MKFNQRRQFAQVALFSFMALCAGSAFAQTERPAPGLPTKGAPGSIIVPSGAPTAIAAPNAYIKICKQTTTSNPVSGSFTFTIDSVVPLTPPTPTRTVIVPVGGCSGGLMVDAGKQVRISEQPQANIAVSAITVTGPGSLVSTNPAKTTAIVLAPPLTTVVTFVNRKTIVKFDKDVSPPKM